MDRQPPTPTSPHTPPLESKGWLSVSFFGLSNIQDEVAHPFVPPLPLESTEAPHPIAQHPLRYKIGCSWLAPLSPRRKHPAARPLPSPPPECTRRYKAARTTKPIACFVAPSLYVLCPAIPAGFGSTPCPRPAGVERSSCLCAARLL